MGLEAWTPLIRTLEALTLMASGSTYIGSDLSQAANGILPSSGDTWG